MLPLLPKRFILFFCFFILLSDTAFSQGTLVDFSTIPKSGTVLVYAHQDDDLIWMLPFWNITEKFIGGAMPKTTEYEEIIHDQQTYLDNNGHNIYYESYWFTPWSSVTDDEYTQYYWNNDPSYAYLANDHLTAFWDDNDTAFTTHEVDRIKAKIEQYIASTSVSRIITHNNWGEYGHQHHKAINRAVRELAVKYGKDVWMLGCDNGVFQDIVVPSGLMYTYGNYDPNLFSAIKNIYNVYDRWTWTEDMIPSGNHEYIKIVDLGHDKSTILTGEKVDSQGPAQELPGSYIFDGIDDYMTLLDDGNNYTSFTIAMRINPDQIQAMDISKMTEYPSAPTCDRSFYMQSNGHVTARINDGSSKTVSSTSALSAGVWTHILMTSDGANLKLYINGVQEGTVPAGPAYTGYATPEFVLGQAQETAGFFKGQITDVNIFDHVLSDSEIVALSSSGTIYKITSSAGTGGTISPSGAVFVIQNSNRTFTITPNSGFEIADVKVDGSSVGTVSSYTFTNITANHTIEATFSTISTTNLTISGVIANNKIYDGTTTAVLNTSDAVLVGVSGGDNVTLISTGAIGTFANKNVGTSKTVTTSGFALSGTDANKYTLTQPTTTANITKAGLTISGVTANNKAYDATIAATINTGSAALVGVFGGDVVTLVSSGATGVFTNKNVGTAKTVTISGFFISGADAPNYSLTQPTATANITSVALTINGVTANNKVYDGSTSVILNTVSATLSGVKGSDVVSLISTAATGTFANKNVGTAKTVSTSGFTISGTDAANYTLVQPTATANITAAGLTITGVTASNKTYDGTTAAILNTGSTVLSGVFGGDDVTLISTGATGVFANKNVGIAKTVTTSGFTLNGTDAANYTLVQPTTSANITIAGLTITGVTANNKTYDGTTGAILNTGSAALIGVFGGDVVILISTGASGVFADKNVGTAKTITTSGFALNGTDAANYSLVQPTITGNITAAGLTITGITANNKTYDGTTAAILNTGSAILAGIFGGDVVSLISTGASGIFADKNVGMAKTVSTSGFTLNGTDAANYSLIQPILMANITSKVLTIGGSFTVNDKNYDGNTSATIATDNLILLTKAGNDDVALITMATFDDPSVGTGKTVRLTGLSLSGTDALNYSLSVTGAPTTTASIYEFGLTVTGITASNKVYDGTTSATINTQNALLQGVIGSDIVTLVSTGATGTFDNKNAGSDIIVTINGLILAGPDAAKYNLIQPTTTANITTYGLTISGVAANNKVYDGTTDATLITVSATLPGVFGSDNVTLISTGAHGTFSDKNVGISKSVSTSGFTIGGADASNYTLSQPVTSANITVASLTVTGVTADNKLYDGSTTVILGTGSAALNGVLSGDVVTLISTGALGTFVNKNVGAAKTVTTSGFTIGGSDAVNYTIIQPTTTANITPVLLTINGVTGKNKIYDGTTVAPLNTVSVFLTGFLDGDAVSLVTTGVTGSFEDKNIGTAKPVITSGFTLGGTDAGNYIIMQPTSSANIIPATLTITGVTVINKVYDGSISAILTTGSASLAGVAGGDAVALISTGATGAFANKNAGTAKTVTTSGFALSGTDAANYILTQPVLTADITEANLTISGVIANNKVYDGTKVATLNTENAILTGVLGGDNVYVIASGATGTFQDKNVGHAKIISLSDFLLGGNDAGNYTLSQPTLSADISPMMLTVTVNDQSKLYGTTLTFTGTEVSFIGLVPGDLIQGITITSPGANSSAPAGTYLITASGASDNNYIFNYVNGTLVIDKEPLLVSADDETKVYGSPNPPFTISYSGFAGGENSSDLMVLPVVTSAADINSDCGIYDINVSGAADSNYIFTYKKGTLTINKANQTITFNALPSKLRVSMVQQLNAKASSGLPVSFEVSDQSVGEIIEGNTLRVRKDGVLTITAVQEGNKNWNPAPDVSQSLETLPSFDNVSSLFTPNNDGVNDFWYIPDLEQYGKLEVTVYNRYGEAVYKSFNYKNDWDGTWNGHPLPSATYYYIIKSSTRGIIKGVVNIVR